MENNLLTINGNNMNLKDAVEMLKKSVDDFEKHYENGMKTTDYYLDENTEDEWELQYASYLELMEMSRYKTISEVKKGDIILYNEQTIEVCNIDIDINPSRILIKSISGSEFSLPNILVVEVIQTRPL